MLGHPGTTGAGQIYEDAGTSEQRREQIQSDHTDHADTDAVVARRDWGGGSVQTAGGRCAGLWVLWALCCCFAAPDYRFSTHQKKTSAIGGVLLIAY